MPGFTFGDLRVPQRVWAKIKVNPANGCWEWVGLLNKAEYGSLRYEGKMALTHRVLFQLLVEPIKEVLDHKCKNTACCNPSHLRQATRAENNRNSRSRRGSSSRFLGVSERKKTCKWQAQIQLNAKKHHLGYFSNEEHAALAYDRFAKEHFGEFAALNFPDYDGDYSELEGSLRGPPSSKHRGVSRDKKGSRWKVSTRLNGKDCFLGYFTNELDAARAYDAFVIKHQGSSGKLNFPKTSNSTCE